MPAAVVQVLIDVDHQLESVVVLVGWKVIYNEGEQTHLLVKIPADAFILHSVQGLSNPPRSQHPFAARKCAELIRGSSPKSMTKLLNFS
jgi:hypothetical protein